MLARACRFILLLSFLYPLHSSAQLFETDFDDLNGWSAAWGGDGWRTARGKLAPGSDTTCADAGGACAFGLPAEAVDNILSGGDAGWDNYRLTASYRNFDDDAVGFVVRRQDADNYYLLLQSRDAYPTADVPSAEANGVTSRLYKVRNGRSSLLASSDVSYTQNADHLIRIDAVGDTITVYFDANADGLLPVEERLLQYRDDDPIPGGNVGVWAYDNRNLFVDWLRVFEVAPPPTPEDLTITSISRRGDRVRFRFDLDRAATGFLTTGVGTCAEIDPATRQPDAGVGQRIVGTLRTTADTDYCLRACAATPDGIVCGPEMDVSTRGAIIDTRGLSPGHWDLLKANRREHLRSSPTNTRLGTTARFGDYLLVIDGRSLPFTVDHRGAAILAEGALDGRARAVDGALRVTGHPLVVDPGLQREDARWALFSADAQVGYGSYQGRAARTFNLLPGDYALRVRGTDIRVVIAADGQVGVPGPDADKAELEGSTVRPTVALTGEAVAFRVRVVNAGPTALRGGGFVNGRGAMDGDDLIAGATGVRTYALADAREAHFNNMSLSLGYRIDAHAVFGIGKLNPNNQADTLVLAWPSNPQLNFIGDVMGTRDTIAVSQAPAILFDEEGEPTEGQVALHALDTDLGEAGGIKKRYAQATGQDYGRLEWTIIARTSTPELPTVYWVNKEGTRARIGFRSSRQAEGSVQFVVGGCEGAKWRSARETAAGNGTDFLANLPLTPDRDYCVRSRARNEAGAVESEGVSLSTRQIGVDTSGLAGQIRVQRVGPNTVEVVEAGEIARDLDLRMGSYLIDQGGEALAVRVDKDGNATYEEDLEGLFEGAGTRTLVVSGLALEVDATSLSGTASLSADPNGQAIPLGGLEGGAERSLRVLPGDFALFHGVHHGFSVGLDGEVSSNSPGLSGGEDGALSVDGRPVRLDLLPVPGDVGVGAANGQPTHVEVAGGGTRDLRLLPGDYTLQIAGTSSAISVGEAEAGVWSAVPEAFEFLSCVGQGAPARGEGEGTDTLVVRADPCAITAEIVCEEACGDEDFVFQLSEGRGEARGVVRYASGRPVRGDEQHAVAFEVDGGELGGAMANTVDGVARVEYQAPGRRGDYVVRVSSGDFTNTRAFVVIPIRDFTPPVVEPRGRVEVEQSNADGTPFNLQAPRVSDNVDPAPEVTSDAPRTFPLGRTVVTWRAEDFNGNRAVATQEVFVVDTTAPTLRAPRLIEVEAKSPAGTIIPVQNVQAEDICDARPELGRDGPARFPVGEMEVTWTATDDSGNEATAQMQVRVLDTQPPQMVFGEAEILLEKTNALGARAVDLPLPAVSDNGDPDPEVEHNAPVNLPVGRTIVTYFARDASGNESSVRVPVTVIDSTPPRVTVRGEADGWASRVDLDVTVFDRGDVFPTVRFEPAPDGLAVENGHHLAAYTTEGTYDIAVAASDDDGNTTRRVLRTFGIDHTTPRVRARTALAEAQEIDVEDETTWPVFFEGEAIELSLDITDAPAGGVSGIARVRMVLDAGEENEADLLDLEPELEGAALPAGPAALRGVVCDHGVICTGGAIDGRELGDGAHTISITVSDVAGNSWSTRLYLRTFGLRGALEEAERLIEVAGEANGVANEAAVALAEAADWIALAAALAEGQPAGIDAEVDLIGTILLHAQRAGPALRRASRFGVEVDGARALIGRALYWAVATFGQINDEPEIGDQGDYDTAADLYLPEAARLRDAGELEGALAALSDAYFFFDNALRPFRASAFGEGVRTTRAVHAQIAAYVEDDARPGQDVLDPTLQDLAQVADSLETFLMEAGEHEDEEDQIRALAEVDAHEYLQALLALQRTARRMQAAGRDNVWIRNWAWGLVQTTMLLADLGAKRSRAAEPVFEAEDIALLDEADELVAQGQGLIDDRRIDAYIELFLAPRTTCVIILSYNRAFLPLVPVPEGCE